MRLKDRIAVVTGAAGGLGVAISARLAEEGASLHLVDCVEGSATARLADRFGRTVIATIANVTSSHEIDEVVQKTLDMFGRIDVLVNVAGITSHGSCLDIDEIEWERVIRVNLTSVFLFCKAVLPTMRKQKYGRIINMGSVLGKNGGNPRPWISPAEQSRAGNLAYGASKAGVHAITLFLAKETAKDGITVNAIAPGPIASNMTRDFSPALMELIPVGRLGLADEVADAVAFLAGDKAAFVTGEILDVNGGLWVD